VTFVVTGERIGAPASAKGHSRFVGFYALLNLKGVDGGLVALLPQFAESSAQTVATKICGGEEEDLLLGLRACPKLIGSL
jgi:hypothetical protein